MCIGPEGNQAHDIRSLGPRSHKVLRKCKSAPHKVTRGTLLRIGFQCAAGLIAFLEEDDKFVIVDAVTGTVVLSQLVPSDFELRNWLANPTPSAELESSANTDNKGHGYPKDALVLSIPLF
ncbi:hypothetical protein Pelo_15322 [Pelomyxa schiedti]|nr:hypothetical protein Pelo_15322 [Pelomyxa schiedti]